MFEWLLISFVLLNEYDDDDVVDDDDDDDDDDDHDRPNRDDDNRPASTQRIPEDEVQNLCQSR